MYATLGMFKGSGVSSGAYPVIVGVEQTVLTSGTSRNVSLPATISAGQMILITVVTFNTSIASIPSDYTSIGTGMYYKIAIGGETIATFTVSISGGDTNFLAMVLAPVHQTTPPEAASTSSSDDPPSVTATWGAANNLAVASLSTVSSGGSISAYPTNCPLYRQTFTAEIYDAGVAAAQTLLATFNPDTFTATFSNQVAKHIMVRGT